jgi:hypothetical protein
MESMKAFFTAYQLTFWCVECGHSLEREKGEMDIWKHSTYETLLRKSRCRYAGLRFKAPTIMLEPVEGSNP